MTLLTKGEFLCAFVAAWVCSNCTAFAADSVRDIIVTNNLSLPKDSEIAARLVIRASGVTIDGSGATLVGPGQVGDFKSMEDAGAGILVEGATGVTITNLRVRGFANGLVLRKVTAAHVSGCDFSDNYHNPKHGWGELPARGGLLLEQVRHSIIRNNRANRTWDALHLVESDDNLVEDNDFSDSSNTCAKLWKSSRNKFLRNNLSYGIRIDRAAGEVHARDSTCVLIETGSDDNYWFRNDITHGGDGIFIRPLNRWISRGNVFIENDTSYANNNCVESWSPGNIFIRNKANHGSYGFWLGGSDQTVLIGNEAAYNGLTNGYHNAPEPGFRHGGIVIVGGSSSHTLIEGNYLHHNNGAGLAFRGDVGSQGRAWRTEHWIVQQNRIENNRFGIWGRWGEAVLLAGNSLTNNAEGNYLTNINQLVQLSSNTTPQAAPIASLVGPEVAQCGTVVRLDASASYDPQDRPLNFHWLLNGTAGNSPILEKTFHRPGFYRLGLTVENGERAGMAWRDLLVVEPVKQEIGTEGQAANWGFECESDTSGTGKINFSDESSAISGTRALRLTPNPYPGAYVTAVFPGARDANWNWSGRKELRFWVKANNPNVPGWQNAGPVVRLVGESGEVVFKPAKGANLLNDPPYSEARWLWFPVQIPLSGDSRWERSVTGEFALERVRAVSLSFDSYGYEPFTIWLDGLTVE